MRLDIIDSLPKILQDSAVTRDIIKGQRLFRKGDRAEYVYSIKQGRFQEISYPDARKMAVLQILSRGETLGETSLFFERYHSTAIAKVPSQIIVYPKYILLDNLQQYPQLTERAIAILSKKIYELQKRLELRDISVADIRVLKYLNHKLNQSSLDRDNSKTLILNAPLQEIAAELGFVPGTLSRALNKLEANQTITRNKNQITINDSDAA